jgi:potassium efflux system protein
VERPVKVGDTVTIGQTTGRVDRINMRSTMIVTGENTGVIIPNKDLISSTVTNWSAASTTLREAIKIGIAFGSDTSLFRKIVLDAVESHGLVLKRPGPEVAFVGFGPSSLDFVVRYSIRMSTSGARVRSDLLHAFDAAFRKNGIEIPYPQQGITLRREPAPDEAARAAPED